MNSWLIEMLSAITIIQILNIRNLVSTPDKDSAQLYNFVRFRWHCKSFESETDFKRETRIKLVNKISGAVENCQINLYFWTGIHENFIYCNLRCSKWLGVENTRQAERCQLEPLIPLRKQRVSSKKPLVAIVKYYGKLLEYVWVGLWRTDPTR